MKPRVTSFAPQFLVDDLERSIAYYQKIGFKFGDPWDGFYAIGHLDGLELHLKEAPKNQAERRHRRDNEHLDASAGVEGIEAFYEQCLGNGATIIKPLPRGPQKTSMSRIPMATSSASVAALRQSNNTPRSTVARDR
jgi:catechol 2,3-dioxygenase-like lactoylglutathione lyase family enzyme